MTNKQRDYGTSARFCVLRPIGRTTWRRRRMTKLARWFRDAAPSGSSTDGQF